MPISRRTCVTGLAAGALLLPSAVTATTHRVPDDWPTIQEALDHTVPGDSVLVAPGTYDENLNMRDGVVLLAELGAAVTTVDGGLLDSVVRCESVTDFSIEGFTLRRGRTAADPGGAGVAMHNAQGRVVACDFIENQSERDGGGMGISGSDAVVRDCTFHENSAYIPSDLDGGGIYCYLSTMLVEDCVFTRNLAHEGGGIVVTHASDAIIRRCIFANNEATSLGVAGGAIGVSEATALIENNTMVNNITPFDGGSVFLYGPAIEGTFQRNIIVNASGVGIICGSEGISSLSCNDVWNSGNSDYDGCAADPSNFSADPLFCDLAALDLRLDGSSPCAPGNSPPGCGLIGALEVGCGPTVLQPATWGEIKAGFAPHPGPGGNDGKR